MLNLRSGSLSAYPYFLKKQGIGSDFCNPDLILETGEEQLLEDCVAICQEYIDALSTLVHTAPPTVCVYGAFLSMSM